MIHINIIFAGKDSFSTCDFFSPCFVHSCKFYIWFSFMWFFFFLHVLFSFVWFCLFFMWFLHIFFSFHMIFFSVNVAFTFTNSLFPTHAHTFPFTCHVILQISNMTHFSHTWSHVVHTCLWYNTETHLYVLSTDPVCMYGMIFPSDLKDPFSGVWATHFNHFSLSLFITNFT